MAKNTREKLLDVALEQFAERGFEGASIASIADALGLSKQALLHHFSTKEKLYGELLASISRGFEERVKELDEGKADLDSLAAMLVAFAADSRGHRRQTALLMRELLDNRQRASRAGIWYLRPFLDLLMERVRALPRWKSAERGQVAAVVYQLLGAINYFAISSATLSAMFEDGTYEAMEEAFADQLHATITHTLAAGPGGGR